MLLLASCLSRSPLGSGGSASGASWVASFLAPSWPLCPPCFVVPSFAAPLFPPSLSGFACWPPLPPPCPRRRLWLATAFWLPAVAHVPTRPNSPRLVHVSISHLRQSSIALVLRVRRNILAIPCMLCCSLLRWAVQDQTHVAKGVHSLITRGEMLALVHVMHALSCVHLCVIEWTTC